MANRAEELVQLLRFKLPLPFCNSHPCRSRPDKVLRSLKGQHATHFLLLRHQMLVQQLVITS